jgi:hypothetical protein
MLGKVLVIGQILGERHNVESVLLGCKFERMRGGAVQEAQDAQEMIGLFETARKRV